MSHTQHCSCAQVTPCNVEYRVEVRLPKGVPVFSLRTDERATIMVNPRYGALEITAALNLLLQRMAVEMSAEAGERDNDGLSPAHIPHARH